MENTFTIVVCSHSVYPHIRSSEGIVNRNWFDILYEKNGNTGLLSSEKSIDIINGRQLTSVDNNILKALYYWSKLSKNSVAGLLYRIFNKIGLRVLNLPKESSLYQMIWVKIQTKKILKITNILENSIFWSRILPTFSILPILEVWNQKRIPFIININDPFLNNLEGYSYEEKILINTRDKAQCWTFPSQRLSNLMANRYGLDEKRCFVIPHAMRKQDEIYDCNKPRNGKLKFVYTGTFYKSAFTDSFGNELVKFSLSKEMKKVEFIFILSQYDTFSLQWLNKNIPEAKIYSKLSRDKVLEIALNADCMLVIDSITHKNLLKGKLIEAISQGLPIFGVTYQNSVLDKVVKEYGGISSYQNIENDISDKLCNLARNLEDSIWLSEFDEKRKNVMEKISEENIAKATIEITQYALDRFLWQQGKSQMEPITPKKCNWP
jgi:glycosyltransferase involved in cell wall biosynthesis